MPGKAGNGALAREFVKRLNELGFSRARFATEAGISRQTIYNIETEAVTYLRATTYALLDRYLYWQPGTARSLAEGITDTATNQDVETREERAAICRWQIIERISDMPIEELTRLVALMEERAFGRAASDTAEHIELMQAEIERMRGPRGENPANHPDNAAG
jgi:transcriptional regulator with XRE-family HTH domain